MIDITEYLEQLNLTEIESKLFITLLQSGPITVRELAELVYMKRTTAYLYIDQLVEKGLVMKIVKGTHKLIAVVDPEVSIQNLVEQKVKNASALKAEFSTILKSINETLPAGKEVGEAEIKFYKGMNNVKKIYEEAFNANEICSYVKLIESDDLGKVFSNNIATFSTAFSKNPNLTIREILYDSPLTKEQAPKLLAKNNRYSYKFMPRDLQLSSEDILIYDGTVAIVNYKGKVSSVVLHSFDYYKNSKELFDFIWKILP